jgi:two-component system OmpR family response regulator
MRLLYPPMGRSLTGVSSIPHRFAEVRVLVVEDEVRMAALIKRGLEEDGYAVDVAVDGRDALWQATEFSYDAVLLDLMLPELDGVSVCRELRSAGRWMPVLMLTARDAVEDRVRGLDAGADDYLVKPFSFAELSARVRALVRRGAVARPTELVVDTLRLDPATRLAWRDRTELDLSSKEFALLELFMRHPGQVLTRTRILEHVWDFAYDGVSNVVDQYVLYLRRKIDRPFGLDQLETVRGAGYRLRTEPRTAGTAPTAGTSRHG